VQHTLAAGRYAYVHVARGQVHVNGTPLHAGDAARLEDESTITLDRGDAAEVLLFDLA
jgi:redox-sensitive bicupin YhaK (pirin superfamily)